MKRIQLNQNSLSLAIDAVGGPTPNIVNGSIFKLATRHGPQIPLNAFLVRFTAGRVTLLPGARRASSNFVTATSYQIVQ